MGVSVLARRYRVDVSADASTWVQLLGITDFNPQVSPTKKDTTTYDNTGWASSEITLNAWSASVKLARQTNAGVLDPAQEMLRARVAQFGTSARIYVRWYDRSGLPEAYQGYAIVEWSRSKTAADDVDEATVNLTGDGALANIANPYAAAAVPVVLSATPSNVATGGLVTISGQNFTGTVVTTGVKFGGVNATSWSVVSDSTIVAVMPAGSAGAANIVVTNAAGASTAFTYTRG